MSIDSLTSRFVDTLLLVVGRDDGHSIDNQIKLSSFMDFLYRLGTNIWARLHLVLHLLQLNSSIFNTNEKEV